MEENNNIQEPTTGASVLTDDTIAFDYKAATPSIIKVIGVGGGGGNAVNHMYKEGINDVTFMVVNTDAMDLRKSPIPHKLQLGDGLGAGARPEKARNAAIESEDDIRAALNDGTNMVFITAGMGGGTGTGASPIVAKVAKEMGLLTVAIVTIPFQFEGPRKIKMALEGVDEIRKYVDALLIVNNNRLSQIYPDLDFLNAFSKADDTLTAAGRSISDIINKSGYINLDFADVTTTLKDSGVAIISTGVAEGESRVTKAFENAITSPLLMGNDIHRAKHLLFALCLSKEHPISMTETQEINDFVAQFENENIEVIWGAYFEEDLDQKVKVIVLASGFGMDGENEGKTPSQAAIEEAKARREEIERANKAKAEEERLRREKEENDAKIRAQIAQLQAMLNGGAPLQAPTTPAGTSTTTPATEPLTSLFDEKDEPADEPDPATHTDGDSSGDTTPAETTPATTPVATSGASTTPITPVTPDDDGFGRIASFYGTEVADKMVLQSARQAYYIFDDDELDNEQLIDQLEQMPAYNRRKSDLAALNKSTAGDSHVSPNGTIKFN